MAHCGSGSDSTRWLWAGGKCRFSGPNNQSQPIQTYLLTSILVNSKANRTKWTWTQWPNHPVVPNHLLAFLLGWHFGLMHFAGSSDQMRLHKPHELAIGLIYKPNQFSNTASAQRAGLGRSGLLVGLCTQPTAKCASHCGAPWLLLECIPLWPWLPLETAVWQAPRFPCSVFYACFRRMNCWICTELVHGAYGLSLNHCLRNSKPSCFAWRCHTIMWKQTKWLFHGLVT